MKKAVAILLIITLAVSMAMPVFAEPAGTVGKFSPTLDGIKDEAYDQSFSFGIFDQESATAGEGWYSTFGEAETSMNAKIYYLWDDKFLYAFVEVIMNNVTDAGNDFIMDSDNPWESDSIELWFLWDDLDDNVNRMKTSVEPHHGKQWGDGPFYDDLAPNGKAVAVMTDKGYNGEFQVAIPAEYLKEGVQIKATLQVNDFSADGTIAVGQQIGDTDIAPVLTLGAPITVAAAPAAAETSAGAAGLAGPFFDTNVDDIPTSFDLDEYLDGSMKTESNGTGLAAASAAAGQAVVPNRQFVEGNESEWNDEKECASMLFDGMPETKYGSHIDNHAYRAVWKYSDAFVAGNLLLCTANDSEGSPRRMDDGWTLAGSNDGSSWTVIYTGKGEDYGAVNFGWFVIPLAGNSTAYSFYKLESEFGYDDNGIQISELELTAVPQAAPDVDETAAGGGVENVHVEAAPAPAPAAPPTGDASSIFVLFGFGLLAAAGFAVSVLKKKRI